MLTNTDCSSILSTLVVIVLCCNTDNKPDGKSHDIGVSTNVVSEGTLKDGVTYVVDNIAVLNSMPEYKKARLYLDNLKKDQQEELKKAYEDLQRKAENYESDQLSMSENEKKGMRNLLLSQRQEIEAKAERVEREYELESDRKLSPIMDTVSRAVKQILSTKKDVVVVDKRYCSYYDKDLDITELVKGKVASISNVTNTVSGPTAGTKKKKK